MKKILIAFVLLLAGQSRAASLETAYKSVTVAGSGELGFAALTAQAPQFPISCYFYKGTAPGAIDPTQSAIYTNNGWFNNVTVNTYDACVYSQYTNEFRFYSNNGGGFVPGDVYNVYVEYMSIGTQTVTPTRTVTPTNTITITRTRTITPSSTITVTRTRTITPSITPTLTVTITGTYTKTNTKTPTNTPCPTITKSSTSTVTPTNTPTPTITATPTGTFTVTLTQTP